MNIYATVEDYRAFTDDEQTPAKKIELYLRQQSAKLTAAANIKSELSEEAQSLACENPSARYLCVCCGVCTGF